MPKTGKGKSVKARYREWKPKSWADLNGYRVIEDSGVYALAYRKGVPYRCMALINGTVRIEPLTFAKAMIQIVNITSTLEAGHPDWKAFTAFYKAISAQL